MRSLAAPMMRFGAVAVVLLWSWYAAFSKARASARLTLMSSSRVGNIGAGLYISSRVVNPQQWREYPAIPLPPASNT